MKKLPKNSFYTGELARGCIYCSHGSKMVLLVTGLCHAKCFYCPLSEKKKDKDVIYADEMLVKSDDDIIMEAELIEAEGTGITGGDPLVVPDRTAYYIKLLKNYFGKEHHIHLYTSTLSMEKVRKVIEAGLDEIRFHPVWQLWNRIEETKLKEIVKSINIDVGLEIPVIPHLKEETRHLLETIDKYGFDFINLNELEFSYTNVDRLSKYGYVAKNDVSSAVKGSEEMAYEILQWGIETPLHYCSASFKDAIQLKNRIARRARNVAKRYDFITEDGTLLKGIIMAGKEKIEEIKKEFGIADDMIGWDEEKKRIETSPFILEEIADYLPYECYIIEEYPTADRLEVERTPL